MNKINYGLIGNNIRKIRLKNNMTQEQVAEIANISINYLSHIENGLSKFSLITFVNLVNALNTTPNRLLFHITENRKCELVEEINNILIEFDEIKLMFILIYIENLKEYELKKSN